MNTKVEDQEVKTPPPEGKEDENNDAKVEDKTPPEDPKSEDKKEAQDQEPKDKKELDSWVYPRIDELTAKRKAAEEEAQRQKARVAELEAEIAKNKRQPKKEESPLSQEEIEKIAEARAQKKFFDQRCNQVYQKGLGIEGFQENIAQLNRSADEMQLTGLYAAILEFDEPEKLLNEVAGDLTKAHSIMKMNAFGAAKELTKISMALSKPPETKSERKKADPIKPTVSDSGGDGDVTVDLYDKDTKKEDWFRERERQLEEKRNKKR